MKINTYRSWLVQITLHYACLVLRFKVIPFRILWCSSLTSGFTSVSASSYSYHSNFPRGGCPFSVVSSDCSKSLAPAGCWMRCQYHVLFLGWRSWRLEVALEWRSTHKGSIHGKEKKPGTLAVVDCGIKGTTKLL